MHLGILCTPAHWQLHSHAISLVPSPEKPTIPAFLGVFGAQPRQPRATPINKIEAIGYCSW